MTILPRGARSLNVLLRRNKVTEKMTKNVTEKMTKMSQKMMKSHQKNDDCFFGKSIGASFA
jgi:uncharacterized protein YbbK (DUF523 family)